MRRAHCQSVLSRRAAASSCLPASVQPVQPFNTKRLRPGRTGSDCKATQPATKYATGGAEARGRRKSRGGGKRGTLSCHKHPGGMAAICGAQCKLSEGQRDGFDEPHLWSVEGPAPRPVACFCGRWKGRGGLESEAGATVLAGLVRSGKQYCWVICDSSE